MFKINNLIEKSYFESLRVSYFLIIWWLNICSWCNVNKFKIDIS